MDFMGVNKLKRRLRRQTSQTQDHHRIPSEGLSNNIGTILDMLKSSIKERLSYVDACLPLHGDLAEIKADVKIVKETGMILTSEMNAIKQKVNQMEQKINTCLCDLGAPIDNTSHIHADKDDTVCGCSNTTKVKEAQQSDKCEQNQAASCLEVLKAGCNKSDVYQLSLGTDTTQVNVKIILIIMKNKNAV